MRCVILSAGKFSKNSSEERLFNIYVKRLAGSIALKEVTAGSSLSPHRRVEIEAKAFLKALPINAYVIVLDENGKALSSAGFAEFLDTLSQTIIQPLYFIIGGAHGLAPSVKERANFLLSLGPMTWPHLLMRTLLAEQLYRTHTISSGHPYHK